MIVAAPAWLERSTDSLRETAFRRLPLACMAGAACVGGVGEHPWPDWLAVSPWLVSLCVIGLPHGAADFAASRRAWRGWPLAGVWLAYGTCMAAVAAGFWTAPLAAIVAFAALSCWHFGAAHLDADAAPDGQQRRPVDVVARGGAVLAMPLAAWPQASANAATDLAALVQGSGSAPVVFPPAAVQAVGIALLAITVAAAAAAGLGEVRRPDGPRAWLRLVVDMAVIMALGWCTDPLFSVGLYFLAWHGWRQMVPLAEALTDSTPGSWREIGHAIARIHADALPLLVPTWGAIGAAWWLWSSTHSVRDLAIVSIAAYLVVTPAHELLGDLLRAMAGRRAVSYDAASSRKTPIFRNFS